MDKPDAKLSELFSGTIEAKRTIEGTGVVTGDVENFRLRVDLDPRYFETKILKKKSFVKQTSEQLLFRNDLRSRWVYQDDEIAHQIGIESYLSFWRLWTYFNGNIETNPGRETVDEATLNGVFGRFQTRAGLLTTRGRNLVPAFAIVGAGVFTQPLLQSEGDSLRGSRFEIFVPQRSKVYFYRDGKTIDTQLLARGKQEVDTRRFPQGNYFVDVEIAAGGANSKQRYFYAKSGVLAPKGFPQISLFAGRVRQNTKLLDNSFYSASVVQRVLKTLDIGAHSYGDAESQVHVLSSTAVFYAIIAQAASSWSTENNFGYSFNLGGSIGDFNLSFDYEKSNLLQVGQQGTSSFPEIVFNVDSFRDEDISVDSDEFFRARLGYITSIGELRYEYFQKKLGHTVQERFHGPTLRLRLLNNRKNDLSFEAGYVFSEKQDLLFANLNWQNYSGRSSFVNGLGTRRTDKQTLSLVSAFRYYDRDSQSLQGTRGSVQNQLDWAEGSGFRDTVRGDLEQNFRYAGLRLDSSLFRNDENTQFATSGELRTSFGVFGSGKAYIGANAEGDAQIVVDIENDAKDGTTVIEIEGGQKTKVVGSRRIVFGVTPYREYRVSISPDEDAPITDYDTKIVDVLLYPGHSQFIQFKLRRLFVAIGSLVDKDGKPMTEVVIKGAKDDIATEEDGTFQVEIAGDEVLKAQVEGGECTVQLPKLEKEPEYFHEFGEVQCLRVK